jgi:hypothetical protein
VETATHLSQEDMWIIEVTSLPVPQEQVNQMAEHLNKFKSLLIGYVLIKAKMFKNALLILTVIVLVLLIWNM